MTVVAIIGSRGFSDGRVIERTVVRLMGLYPELLTVVSGGADGADSIAREVCKRLGFHVCTDENGPGIDHLSRPTHFAELLPDYARYGRYQAPRLRNGDVIRHVEEVYAFFAPGRRSPGTTHALQLAQEAKKPMWVYQQGVWARE